MTQRFVITSGLHKRDRYSHKFGLEDPEQNKRHCRASATKSLPQHRNRLRIQDKPKLNYNELITYRKVFIDISLARSVSLLVCPRILQS